MKTFQQSGILQHRTEDGRRTKTHYTVCESYHTPQIHVIRYETIHVHAKLILLEILRTSIIIIIIDYSIIYAKIYSAACD
jgi:hypothetical protein